MTKNDGVELVSALAPPSVQHATVQLPHSLNSAHFSVNIRLSGHVDLLILPYLRLINDRRAFGCPP